MSTFYKPDFQKFSMFPGGQKTQPSIYFKTSGQDFQTFIQTIDWDFEAFRGNQKVSPVF